VDGADLAAVYALPVDTRDAEVRVLPLDHHERDPFVRRLDRVSVSQLVRLLAPSSARSRPFRLRWASGSGGGRDQHTRVVRVDPFDGFDREVGPAAGHLLVPLALGRAVR
jgi:hypothetical protein